MKNFVIVAILGVVALGSIYFIFQYFTDPVSVDNNRNTPITSDSDRDGVVKNDSDTNMETDESLSEEDEVVEEPVDETKTKIGSSVNGKSIMAYHYGEGETELLFVGGIHGGYSWNTAAVAYELMDYLDENPDVVPENIKVTVVPVLNPDGLQLVTGRTGAFKASDISVSAESSIPGRFNANQVDLNRNFACDWQSSGTWQDRPVSGGDGAFSEPESQAIRSYIESNGPEAVVVWYSAAGGVFSSSCHNGVLSETKTLTNLYAKAAGYQAYEEFDFYEITGDMVNWLASEGVPAISVLLTSHESVEWDKNRAGVEALFNYYAE